MAAGGLAAPAAMLERLGEALRAGAGGGGLRLTDAARLALGLSEADANRLLRGLGFVPLRKAGGEEPRPWRRRSLEPVRATAAPAPLSPFAALAALKSPAPAPPRRGSRRRAPRAARPVRIADGG
jgi:ATP-dependent RNA helicase SUPV3L1/SUV3